jgi:hypothetical protein
LIRPLREGAIDMAPRSERRSVRLDRDGCRTHVVSVAAITAGKRDRERAGR